MTVPDYITAVQIKQAMPSSTQWGSGYDTELAALATRVSRLVDKLTGRDPGAFAVAADTTRYFTGNGSKLLLVDELAAAPTTVAVAETGDIDDASGTGGTYTTWSTADYLPYPYNALERGEPYTALELEPLNGAKSTWTRYPKGVKITGKFGYSTAVPGPIMQACLIQVVRWLKRAQQSFQDTGAIAELGKLTYTQKLDPDVVTILETTYTEVAI